MHQSFLFNIPAELTQHNDPTLFVEVIVESYGSFVYKVDVKADLNILCFLKSPLELSEKIFEHAKQIVAKVA